MNIIQAAMKHPEMVKAYHFNDLEDFLKAVPSWPKKEFAEGEVYASNSIVKLKEALPEHEFMGLAGGDYYITIENNEFVSYAVGAENLVYEGTQLYSVERTVIDHETTFFALFFDYQDATARWQTKSQFKEMFSVNRSN